MANTEIIVIQQLRTIWTKASRGGPRAILRNATPETAHLPQYVLRSPDLTSLYHRVDHREREGFVRQGRDIVVENPVVNPFIAGCVEIGQGSAEKDNDKIYLKFEYNRQYGGAPDRSWVEKTLLLERGQWGQIVYNGRFSAEEGGWWYQKTVVNAGIFPSPLPSTAVFTRTEPAERFLAMGHLL